jgi:hypothetical protein
MEALNNEVYNHSVYRAQAGIHDPVQYVPVLLRPEDAFKALVVPHSLKPWPFE